MKLSSAVWPPPSAYALAAAFDITKTTMIVWGWPKSETSEFMTTSAIHWLYNTISRTWRKLYFETVRDVQVDSSLCSNSVFEERLGIVIQMSLARVHRLAIEERKWLEVNTTSDSDKSLSLLMGSDAVYVNSVVLLFGGAGPQSSYATARVWTLPVRQVSSKWSFRLNTYLKPSQPPRIVGAWSVIGNWLVYSPPSSIIFQVFLRLLMQSVQQQLSNETIYHPASPTSSLLVYWMTKTLKNLVANPSVLQRDKKIKETHTVSILDLNTLTSWQYSTFVSRSGPDHLYVAGVNWNDKALVAYGGVSVLPTFQGKLSRSIFTSDIWVYFVDTRLWIQVRTPNIKPAGRAMCSLTSIGNNSLFCSPDWQSMFHRYLSR